MWSWKSAEAVLCALRSVHRRDEPRLGSEQGAARLRSFAGLLHSHLATAHAGTLVDRDSEQQDHCVGAVAFQYAIGAGTVPASRTEKQGQYQSRDSSSGVRRHSGSISFWLSRALPRVQRWRIIKINPE